MLIADINGKLTINNEVSEDFLTSSAFSTFDFLPNIWLKKFLETSINLNGDFLDFPSATNKFLFWKRFRLPNGRGVEPDLIILAEKTAFIIESKFYSGKSDVGFIEEDGMSSDNIDSTLIDQIAREYLLGREFLRGMKLIVKDKLIEISDFFVILVTKDSIFPKEDVKESLDALNRIIPMELKTARNKIFWTNWQKINPILEEITQNYPEHSFEMKIASQLSAFLRRRDLVPFQGFKFLSSVEVVNIRNEPVFYHKEKIAYWSNKLFRNLIGFECSYIFYVPEKRHYWENFKQLVWENEDVFYKKYKK